MVTTEPLAGYVRRSSSDTSPAKKHDPGAAPGAAPGCSWRTRRCSRRCSEVHRALRRPQNWPYKASQGAGAAPGAPRSSARSSARSSSGCARSSSGAAPAHGGSSVGHWVGAKKNLLLLGSPHVTRTPFEGYPLDLKSAKRTRPQTTSTLPSASCPAGEWPPRTFTARSRAPP